MGRYEAALGKKPGKVKKDRYIKTFGFDDDMDIIQHVVSQVKMIPKKYRKLLLGQVVLL